MVGMTFLTGDRPTEEGRGLENDGGGGRNERLGVEIEMALKHVMLRKERERVLGWSRREEAEF